MASSADLLSNSGYAGVALDKKGNSSFFLTRTNKEHQATMEHPFMKSIYAQTFDKEAYGQYLASLHLQFSELECLCLSLSSTPPLSSLFDKSLNRSEALTNDLEFWFGPDWKLKANKPTVATGKYLEQLREDSKDPWLLLCHHFLQYNAVLSGGQFLGSMVSSVSARAGATPPVGAEFYVFGCQPHARVQQYLDDLDQLHIPAIKREEMLTCMRSIYLLLLAIFDEAFALAPVEGVSYADSKKRNSSTGTSGEAKKPPPPLPVGDQKFLAKELLRYNGKTKGMEILTSVLGRVYDVSSGAEFFGPSGPYEMFSGHDGTYNLAVMSLKQKTLDVFDYDLDTEDKECLADWIAYFDNRYGRPLGMLVDRNHTVSLSELPPATKIPFANIDNDDDHPSPQHTSKL